MSYTIVGVIGHIDHGKTSLVAALSGVDTDTHPEEKRRGITIDLGFASFSEGDHEFALIDAPGHQKYIGNLLAGVSGVDVGLLVVACDQGIQQQTLEHAAILQMLGVRRLVVALSRIDLAAEEQQLELTEELEVFLADFGFTDIPIVPLSSVTGQGLDAIRVKLCEFARTSERISGSFFRMPIDRVFSVPGRGCVVAGTVWSGEVQVGDTICVASTNARVRVRELEVHGESVNASRIGRRTAMNITGVATDELHRGDELVAADAYSVGRQFLIEIRMFREAPDLRCPATVQMHTATTSCEARISGVRRLSAGEQAVAVVDTSEPVVATVDQQCLFRLPYPTGSVSGGRILATVDARLRQKRKLTELGRRLVRDDARGRLTAWVEFLGELEFDSTWLELQVGIPQDAATQTVAACVDESAFLMPIEGRLVSHAAVERIKGYVVKVLTKQSEESEDAWSVEESVVQQVRSTGSPSVIRWVLQKLIDEKQLVRLGNLLAVASDKTALSRRQRARMELILGMFEGVRAPPSTKEISKQLDLPIDGVESLLRFATQQGILTEIAKGLLISTETFLQLCRELRDLFDDDSEPSVAAIRDRWQVTRKHTIPFLEYCDKVGATRRAGDVRVAGPRLNDLVGEELVDQD